MKIFILIMFLFLNCFAVELGYYDPYEPTEDEPQETFFMIIEGSLYSCHYENDDKVVCEKLRFNIWRENE